MWADASLWNDNHGLSKNNFSKFEFESGGKLETDSFEGFDQTVVGALSFGQNRLNCTESVLISPYFRSEAKKLRDQVWAQLEEEGLVRNSSWVGKPRAGRQKRDGYGKTETKVVVRCKTSYTGLFSFLAIPLLMGDIMIEFMNMIDINVNIMITTAATTTATTAAPNNNNNNNNNGGAGGGGSGSGSGNNNNNNNPRSLFGKSDWLGSRLGLGLPHRHKRGGLTSTGWQGLAEIRSRLEVLMREYLSKTSSKQLTQEVSSSQGTKAEALLSGDWTDSAMREATTPGPFAGVAGWKEMDGGSWLPGGTISSSQLMEAFHDIQRLRVEAGPGYALPILI